MGLNGVILTMGLGFGDLDNDGWLDCYFSPAHPITKRCFLTGCSVTTAARSSKM